MKRLQILLMIFAVLSIFAVGCAPATTTKPAVSNETPAAATNPPTEPTQTPASTLGEQETQEPVSTTGEQATAPAPLIPTDNPNAKFKFGMITDQSGLGDQGFNDMAWAGMLQAAKDFNANIKVLESKQPADYVPNLLAFAQQNYDLIVGVGFLLTDAINEVAPQFPDTHFVLVDAVSTAPNVANVISKDEEGAFVVGAIAGMMTKTNKVGFIGGVSSDLMNKFEYGYKAGVKTTNPNATVHVSYVGSFADPATTKQLAAAQYDQGVDVIYSVAGQGDTGSFTAAKEANKMIIGQDLDKNYLAPENCIASVIKRVDLLVYDQAKAVAEGTFKGGTIYAGLKEGNEALSPSTQKMLPAEVYQMAIDLQKMIIDGAIVPPSTPDEFASFVPPKVNWPPK